MVIDASAIAATLTDEPEELDFSERIATATDPFSTPLAASEAALGVARKRSIPLVTGR